MANAERLSDGDMTAITAAVALEIGIEPTERAFRRVPTTRHENPHLEHDKADRHPREYGMAKRAYGTTLARFANPVVTESVSRRRAALDPRNPALKEARSVFISRVFDADVLQRVLISGINNAKLGKMVTKGLWAGSPIYHLSLEERRTCPRSWECRPP